MTVVPFRLGLPKGRMETGVLTLLADAGIRVRPSARGYRPDVSLPGAEAKMLKPQNRSEEHTSELQSPDHLVCRLLLEKKKKKKKKIKQKKKKKKQKIKR